MLFQNNFSLPEYNECEYNDYKVKIKDGKAVNLGNEMGMRVPCILLFCGQSEFIDILTNELSKNM